MKLVDILARKLEVWPGNISLIQKDMGGVWECMPSGALGRKIVSLELAEDWRVSCVTLAQWQAEVDALKATYKVVVAECKSAVKPWTGEGLPPVGTVCEWRDNSLGAWQVVELLYLSNATALIKFVEYKDGDCEGCYSPSDCQFRPIRTPEQIAADQRLHDVRNALIAIHAGRHFPNDLVRGNIVAATVEAMIDAGYRKFEIVEE